MYAKQKLAVYLNKSVSYVNMSVKKFDAYFYAVGFVVQGFTNNIKADLTSIAN